MLKFSTILTKYGSYAELNWIWLFIMQHKTFIIWDVFKNVSIYHMFSEVLYTVQIEKRNLGSESSKGQVVQPEPSKPSMDQSLGDASVAPLHWAVPVLAPKSRVPSEVFVRMLLFFGFVGVQKLCRSHFPVTVRSCCWRRVRSRRACGMRLAGAGLRAARGSRFNVISDSTKLCTVPCSFVIPGKLP